MHSAGYANRLRGGFRVAPLPGIHKAATIAAALTLALGLSIGSAAAEVTLPVAEVPTPSAGFAPEGAQGPITPGGGATQAAPPPVIAGVPALGTTIEGFDFDDNGTVTGGFRFIPPDPIGAAGPDHVVNVGNVSIEWFTKGGVQQNFQSLQSFFGGTATFTFDPKVLYDQYMGRFVVITLEREFQAQGAPGDASRILVAVSKTSNPNDGWWFHTINSFTLIGATSYWADYPGLGVDDNAIYITNNMFSFGTGSYGGPRLWIVHKTGLYSGGAATVTVHDFITPSGGIGTTTQPAHMFGAPQGTLGTFLCMYSGLTNGVQEFVEIIPVNNPTGAVSFGAAQFISFGDIDPNALGLPDAPQLGGPALIEVNDRRALNAVWRDNMLYISATGQPLAGPDVNQTTACWFQLTTATVGAIAPVDFGYVGGEDIAPGTYTFFPSIAVNQSGDVAMGFSASASTIYGGAYYTGRRMGDPAGTMQASGVIAAGTDYYLRTFGGGRNRWGDYSGCSVDPADDCTFWIYNEYAITRGTIISGEDGRWGTRWGSFSFTCGPVPVKLAAFSVERAGDDARVMWQVSEATDHAGFNVYRQLPGADRVRISDQMLFQADGSYEFVDQGAPRDGADYWLAELSRTGEVAWHGPVTLAAGIGLRPMVGLSPAFPNPFQASAKISYSLGGDTQVRLSVFDTMGRKVATLVDRLEGAGDHTASWDGMTASGARAAAGFYMIKLEAGNEVRTQKVVLSR